MPRLQPMLVPTFTAEQLAEARRVAAQASAPHARVRRARLTLWLAEHPLLSHAEVGRQVGLNSETVRKWRRRWTRQPWSLADAPRPGRPKRFSPSGLRDCQGAGL
jgi:hypothetical protein